MAVLRLRVLALVVALTALLLPSTTWARAAATGLRLGAHPEGITRLVLDLSEAIDFTTALYADPYRLVINTPGLTWAEGNAMRKPLGSVTTLRYDEDGLGGRIMLELKEPAAVKTAFVIPPRDGLGWRFVMDLQTTTRAAFLAAAMPVKSAANAKAAPPAPIAAPAPVVTVAPLAPAAAAPAPVEAPRPLVVYSPEVTPPPVAVASTPIAVPPEPRPAAKAKSASPMMSAPMPPPPERPQPMPVSAVTMAPPLPEPVPMVTPVAAKVAAPPPMPDKVADAEPKGLPADGKPVVVIDPGHGGVDPGAIGVSGIYEKFITQAVARELKEQLEKNGRYKVYLTRDRDVFIRLRDRVAVARQYGADLFISLHADSVANPLLKGLSVYTLSQNASDGEAQALADKENKADLIAGIDLSHESADVANILIDLAQRETMNRSAGFAGGMVEEVSREASLLGNTHRFAGFAVLKAPDVPSVLIEMGYLSNEIEERNLRQPEYRAKLAKGIARAVDRFFLQGQKAKR